MAQVQWRCLFEEGYSLMAVHTTAFHFLKHLSFTYLRLIFLNSFWEVLVQVQVHMSGQVHLQVVFQMNDSLIKNVRSFTRCMQILVMKTYDIKKSNSMPHISILVCVCPSWVTDFFNCNVRGFPESANQMKQLHCKFLP